VPRDEDQPPPRVHRALDGLPTVDTLEQVEHAGRAERGKEGGLDRHAAQVRVGRTGDAQHLLAPELGKRGSDLPLDDAAADAEGSVGERAEAGAEGAGAAPAERVEHADGAPHGRVLGVVGERWRHLTSGGGG
jgi:hypothetical protein